MIVRDLDGVLETRAFGLDRSVAQNASSGGSDPMRKRVGAALSLAIRVIMRNSPQTLRVALRNRPIKALVEHPASMSHALLSDEMSQCITDDDSCGTGFPTCRDSAE